MIDVCKTSLMWNNKIMIQQSRNIVIGLIAAVLIGIGGAFFYYQGFGIKPYDAARDKAFIVDFFKKNWYMLISDYSPDYNVEFMLDQRAPTTDDSRDVGKLIMKTYIIDGKPVGFINYYEKELKVAQILFLIVHEEHRGKGYARKLMQYALNDLKKRGILVARLNTRTDNTKARKLYESRGFKQIWTDGAYVIYELIL